MQNHTKLCKIMQIYKILYKLIQIYLSFHKSKIILHTSEQVFAKITQPHYNWLKYKRFRDEIE